MNTFLKSPLATGLGGRALTEVAQTYMPLEERAGVKEREKQTGNERRWDQQSDLLQ